MKLKKNLLLSFVIMVGISVLPGISVADNASQCQKKEQTYRSLLHKGAIIEAALPRDRGGISLTNKSGKAYLEVYNEVVAAYKSLLGSCSKGVTGYKIPKQILNSRPQKLELQWVKS